MSATAEQHQREWEQRLRAEAFDPMDAEWKAKWLEALREMPDDVRALTGMTHHSMSKCIDLNDAQGKSFAEIADIVEREM